uniref:Uncharacterized protein n=1 Tax=Meloidogyne incognita TaxID=6306 RepID=A0A914KTU4_MELIC
MMFRLLWCFLTLLALYNVSAGKSPEISMESQGRNCTFSGVGKCPKGFVCLRGLCAKRCYYKGQCPDGYLCQHAYACVKNICPLSDMNCCPHCPEAFKINFKNLKKFLKKCKKPGDCPQGWSCYITKCRRQECHSKKDCEFEWPCQAK